MEIKDTRLLDLDLAVQVDRLFTKKFVLDIPKDNINYYALTACILIRDGLSYEEAIETVDKIVEPLKEEFPEKYTDIIIQKSKRQVKRYVPPIKVIFCGDRDSCTSFEEQIITELKKLPYGSIVIHGGCRGIDLYVDDLAKQMGIITKSFPVSKEEWSTVGRKAGPLRNEKMLKENPNMILAFHPDIEKSKGTKNMMMQAYKANIDVYIHDLKRKSKFEGDFSVL